uniref:DYW domain-containing protein n=1 Tax=Salix viminalis TaxID=40686 RepID=A0A6N2MVD1_SALVM
MIAAISVVSNTSIPTNLTVISCLKSKKPPSKNPRNLNQTLKSLTKSGNLDEAIRLIESSPSKFTDPETYSQLLHSCISRKSLHHGQRVYKQLLKQEDSEKLLENHNLKSKLITLFSVCGELDEARIIFENAVENEGVPESVWVAMAIGYSKNGFLREALLVYVEMLWNCMEPGNFAFSTALKACADLKELWVGRGVHAQVVKSSEGPDQVVNNSLLRLYTQCECFDEVLKVFDQMPERNIASWNSLISGFVKEDKLGEALDVFRRMQREGVGFSWVTLTTILPICARVTALCSGKEIHVQIVKSARRPDVLLLNSLVDMYVKCGVFDYGRRLFDGMRSKDLTSWNTMLTGYGINGYMRVAMDLFNEMVSCGIRPDDVTFIALLSGCSHAGLTEDGQKLFHRMEMDFGSWKIDDALVVVKTCHEASVAYGIVAHSCRLHSEVPLAEAIAKRLFEIEPYNPGNYVMLSNIYANAGMWDSVNMVREMMQTRRIRKEAGCSWVQVKNKIHTFVAGGGFKFRNSDEYKKVWNKLREAMEEVGYVTNTDVVLHDVNEETKAMWVCGHSERLATVFSLLYTAAGMPIRITKNLRVCIDCHSWIKIVSRVTGRVIVLRDTNRFHHFKEGACSCNDYW